MAKRKTKLQEAASYMGMIGGRSRSPKKVQAARVNGKKGGRPKKVLDKQNA